VGEVVEAVDDPVSGEGDERDRAFVAGFEADGGACGDVEAEAAGGLPVEAERGVHFGEMEVRADLDRTVAGVRHRDFKSLKAGVGFEVGRVGWGEDFAGNHRDLRFEISDFRLGSRRQAMGWWTVTSLV